LRPVQRNFYQFTQSILSQETGGPQLKPGAPVRIVLIFPEKYAVGMANLGFQTVYRLLNEHPEIRCERCFLYEKPFEREARTLESNRPLAEFDVAAVSLSYEMNLLNFLSILTRANIAIFRQERKKNDPLILAGGAVCGLNPSPLLPFMDGLLVGEGEDVFQRMGDLLYEEKEKGSAKHAVLDRLSVLDGFYCPERNAGVIRKITKSLENAPAYTSIVTPKSHFGNMFVTETGRGCMRGCYFCAAQKIYSPYRFHSMESIIETISKKNPGARRIGLEGAGLSDYPVLIPLCRFLLDIGYQVTFSSIRADSINIELVDILDRSGVRTFSIAPEAASEDRRKYIGKGISDDALRNGVSLLSESGVSILKVYFIIGLPGEERGDIEKIPVLVRELARCFRKKDKSKRIRVSINGFIPKPFTEFQWAPMLRTRDMERIRKEIRQELGGSDGIDVISKSSREEMLQGILSQGNEETGMALAESVRENIPWKKVFLKRKIDIDQLIYRERRPEQPLPWDFIQPSVKKDILWKRYQKAMGE